MFKEPMICTMWRVCNMPIGCYHDRPHSKDTDCHAECQYHDPARCREASLAEIVEFTLVGETDHGPEHSAG
jgi:hypothetical protein